MKSMLILITMTLMTLSSHSREPRNLFFRIGQSEGLSANQVQAVDMDEWGFLWIGTSNGLNRCFGSDWVVHRAVPDTPGALSNSNCLALRYDSTRKGLWVGTHGGGLNFYQVAEDRFVPISIQPQKNRIPGGEDIFAITTSPDGRVWFGGSCGLQVIHPGLDKPEHLPLGRTEMDASAPWAVTALALTRKGTLLAGTHRGLWAVARQESPRRIELDGEADHPQRIWSLCPTRSGGVWAGSESGWLFLLDDNFRILRRFHHTRNPRFPSEGINALCLDDRHGLWIGTYGGGLLCLPSNSPLPMPITAAAEAPFTLAGNHINTLWAVPGGPLWVGTDNGLCRYEPALETVRHFGPHEPPPRRMNPADIVALAETSTALWLGTSRGSLMRLGKSPGTGGHTPPEPEITLGTGSVTKLVTGPDDTLWCAAEGCLLHIGTDGQIQSRHEPREDSDQSIRSASLITLMADRQNRLWIGSNNRGVSLLHIPSGRFEHLSSDTVPGLSVWALLQDHKDHFWLGTRDGLFRLTPDLRLCERHTREAGKPDTLGGNWVTALFEDSQKRLWIGTAGGGLSLKRNTGSGFRRFDRRHGLPDDDVLSILEDDQGGLWLGTGRGLCRLDPQSGETRTFGRLHGLGTEDFNIDGALKLRDGRLAYGSGTGLNIFGPDDLLTEPAPGILHLTGLRINTRTIHLSPPLFLRRQIELPYSRDIIGLEFAVQHRLAASLTTRYRLRGWRETWLETDSRNHQAVFGQIPPGSYTLEIQAQHTSGQAATPIRRLEILIPAPFWRTPAFIVSGFLVFALFSYRLISFLTGYLRIRRFWHKTTRIGIYRLGPRIGCGGMAEVYAGKGLMAPHNEVAIKILREDLRQDPRSRRRFHLEAAIIDQLDHPNIVRVLERGIHEDRPYIVMERLHGVTLAQKLETEGPLSLAGVAPMITQVCSALERIHRMGILHRDLKPANIMLIPATAQGTTVKLLDFGLARIMNHSHMTRSGAVMGTLSYLAPELIVSREAERASDIFSLGVLVFELLTGALPYHGGSPGDLLNQILIEPPPPLGDLGLDVPREIEDLVNRMLAKDPATRPQAGQIRLGFSRYESVSCPL
jgi:ligand-binding sensor domain-containing protein